MLKNNLHLPTFTYIYLPGTFRRVGGILDFDWPRGDGGYPEAFVAEDSEIGWANVIRSAEAVEFMGESVRKC